MTTATSTTKSVLMSGAVVSSMLLLKHFLPAPEGWSSSEVVIVGMATHQIFSRFVEKESPKLSTSFFATMTTALGAIGLELANREFGNILPMSAALAIGGWAAHETYTKATNLISTEK
ncbi:MAG: hypothetical protein WAZ18_03840 [Alphaproteobacteria bacterium]